MSARLLRITDWEERAFRAGYKVEAMIAMIPADPKSVCRFFKWRYRMTTKRWLREERCRKALKLLSEGLQNQEIVTELGFADEAHFCNEFSSILGVSPQTFGPILKIPAR